MTNNTNIIENLRTLTLLDYDTMVDLGNEIYAIDELSNYSDSQYICDAISEIANSYIPIYTGAVWENASNISDYIEEAISNGLSDISSGLVSVFQSGYYEYYTKVLYNNFESFKFNYVALALNEYIIAHKLNLDIDLLETEIENEIENIDIDSSFSSITDCIQSIVESIKEGEVNL